MVPLRKLTAVTLVACAYTILAMRVTQAERKRTREALVRAGLQLFAAQGFSATTVDQVTAAAGVAKGTLYNYFPAKEDLALAGLAVALEGPHTRAANLYGLPNLAARLGLLFAELGRVAGGQPELIWIWAIENARRGRAETASARLEAILTDLCADAQGRGELRSDVPAKELAGQLQGVVLAQIARWHHAGAAADLLALLNAAVALYLEGARAR